MSSRELSLGPDVVQMLIPQRRPFLMVDRVVWFEDGVAPGLRSVKYLSANEPFFAGHFPGIALMPGALTFEGLGQTANLLSVIRAIRVRYAEHGNDPDEALDALQNLDHGFSLSRAFKPQKIELLKELVADLAGSNYGLVGSAEMKFLEPIAAGNLVEYEVRLTGQLDSYQHFALEAAVNGRTKARGKLSSIHKDGLVLTRPDA